MELRVAAQTTFLWSVSELFHICQLTTADSIDGICGLTGACAEGRKDFGLGR